MADIHLHDARATTAPLDAVPQIGVPRPRLKWAWAFVVTLGVIAGLGVVNFVLSNQGGSWALRSPSFFLFSLLIFVGQIRSAEWLLLDTNGDQAIAWTFGFALLLMGNPVAAIGVMILSSLARDLIKKRTNLITMANATQIAVSMIAAQVVLRIFGQHLTLAQPDSPISVKWIVAVVAAGFTLLLISGLLRTVAMVLSRGVSLHAALRITGAFHWSLDGALLALAPSFVVVARRSVLVLPLSLITVAVAYRSYLKASRREHEAFHDPLTDLLNRRAFNDGLRNAIANADQTNTRGALFLIDLDDFKRINDNLGHHIGDGALKVVADRIKTRDGGISARLGGDEFAVMLPRIAGIDEAMEYAAKLHRALHAPCEIDGIPMTLAGSVGVTVFPDHGRDLDTIIRAADVAMYEAKRGPKGVIAHTIESEHSSKAGRLSLIADLDRAIVNQELQVVYQPQLSMRTGELVGVEALLRWNHPDHGVIGPGEFMPLAEHTDLLGPVTEYVLEQALSDCGTWYRAGIKMRVAVNISARTMHDRRFTGRIERLLHQNNLPPDALEIEITENALMRDSQRARSVVSQLKQVGVSVAIDDFGIGHSSIGMLKNLPVDAIKIDKSFMMRVDESADDRVLVRCMVDLARNLGLAITAEGIETAGAWWIARELGCSNGQGFHIAHPMPLDGLAEWVLSRHEPDWAVKDAPLQPTPSSAAPEFQPQPQPSPAPRNVDLRLAS